MNVERLSPWLPVDMDLALYKELVPTRPTPAHHDRAAGPSTVLMQLDRERAAWAAAHETPSPDDQKGAA